MLVPLFAHLLLVRVLTAYAHRLGDSDHFTAARLFVNFAPTTHMDKIVRQQKPLSLAPSLPTSTKDPTERALSGLSTLQRWYNHTGLWDTTGWWNGANIMTTIGNLAIADPDNAQLQILAKKIFVRTAKVGPAKNPQPGIESSSNNRTKLLSRYNKTLDAQTYQPHTSYPAGWFVYESDDDKRRNVSIYDLDNSETYDMAPTTLNPEDWLDGFYDDDLWWALAWITAFDVTKHTPYLHLAEGIFEAVASTWSTYCGDGGIYWNWKRGYVGAIENEQFISTAAHLANRVADHKQDYYIEWAERSLQWFINSGMINDDGNINDGLTERCVNNNKTIWSYNQGVILGGLVELNKATSNEIVLPLAHFIAQAALRNLSDSSGIIHDACEPKDCGADGSQFKGVFMRNLGKLYEVAPYEIYAQSIRDNAESIWRNDRGKNGVFSVNWAGPWLAPGNASTHSSAMDALVAAISVKEYV